MNKKSGFVKMLNFLEDKGFYIILVLCVLAIGISGYVLFFGEDQSVPELNLEDYYDDLDSSNQYEIPVIQDEPINEEPVSKPEPTTPPESDQSEPKEQQPKKEETQPSVKVETPEVVELKQPFYMNPVSGAIQKPYSGDELVYCSTMGDWRVHSGIDIAAEEGMRVSAIADGKISDIYFDDMYGWCILIDHADSIQSLYCGLMQNPPVLKGASVKIGDVIGGIGNTNIAESSEPSHLHLEIFKDGEKIDPETILPKK